MIVCDVVDGHTRGVGVRGPTITVLEQPGVLLRGLGSMTRCGPERRPPGASWTSWPPMTRGGTSFRFKGVPASWLRRTSRLRGACQAHTGLRIPGRRHGACHNPGGGYCPEDNDHPFWPRWQRHSPSRHQQPDVARPRRLGETSTPPSPGRAACRVRMSQRRHDRRAGAVEVLRETQRQLATRLRQHR
jgi:hypothetical protein